MKTGNVYRYYHKTEQEYHYVLIYEIREMKTISVAYGVSLVDNTDIRYITKEHWEYWEKVD